ncbi:Uncharacterized protein BP5553_07931 [Venustampulla echinocandica]|uniref:Major facilitator superfamily (MFS) profile domain-containing protein n=1 Tax=Venustampulla echinocandica TaxID=2656787 RepID=A0A370THY5_9HELO|nr:Uncharacterized protein BP5553_07931 [Venustampulla echinocandica]RDL34803.1 Uncharacterized protein BP5553_07931 [Venustampulla echinocandica]
MTIYSILRHVVRNDAIRIDPPEVYNWRILALASSACFAGSLFGVDAGIIGGVLVMPDFKREFGLDTRPPSVVADLSGNLVTTMQAGAVLGALISSPFADRKGRKPALLGVAIAGLIGGIMQAFSYGHLPVFYIGRFIEGIGLGAGTMLAPTYVSENSPRAIRGFLVGFFQLFLVMGSMVAYFINYGSLLHLPVRSFIPARLTNVTLLIILLSSANGFVDGSVGLPSDMPDALIHQHALLSRVSSMAGIPGPVGKSHRSVVRRATPPGRAPIHPARTTRVTYTARPRKCYYARNGILGTAKGVLDGRHESEASIANYRDDYISAVTGAINYYAPTIFKDLGLSGTTTALFAQGIYGIVKVITCLIFVFFLADSLGRRLSLMWSGALQGFCMFFLGFYVRFGPKIGESESPPPAGIAALAMVYIFAAAFNMGWGPVSWIYVSEIPTNRLRAYNVALASLTHWLHNLAVSKATPVMLFSKPYGAYFIFGSLNLTMGILAFWLPETKGISLERMDEIFGAADMSNVEDLGVAAKRAKNVDEQLEEEETVHTSKA